MIVIASRWKVQLQSQRCANRCPAICCNRSLGLYDNTDIGRTECFAMNVRFHDCGFSRYALGQIFRLGQKRCRTDSIPQYPFFYPHTQNSYIQRGTTTLREWRGLSFCRLTGLRSLGQISAMVAFSYLVAADTMIVC